MAKRGKARRIVNRALPAPAAPFAIPLYAPAALAFPYRAQFGGAVGYSVAPIDSRLGDELAPPDRLTAAGPEQLRHLAESRHDRRE